MKCASAQEWYRLDWKKASPCPGVGIHEYVLLAKERAEGEFPHHRASVSPCATCGFVLWKQATWLGEGWFLGLPFPISFRAVLLSSGSEQESPLITRIIIAATSYYASAVCQGSPG
jgi:hypothetical protein